MICGDCKAAADFDALPGLHKVGIVLADSAAALAGHDLCAMRRADQSGLPSCMCQHRRRVKR